MKNRSKSKPKVEAADPGLRDNFFEGRADAAEKKPNIIIIDYKVDQPAAPSQPAVHSVHDWADPREAERFLAEFERRRALAEAQRYLTPPK